LRIQISGTFTDIRASLVSAEFRTIVDLPLEADDRAGSYMSRFTPNAQHFRVLIAGKDAQGVAFQRLHAPLLTPMR
jgi:hypothetical protein